MDGQTSARLECFRDVVFGFAATLLVVSLEVPGDFAALVGHFGIVIQPSAPESVRESGTTPSRYAALTASARVPTSSLAKIASR